VLITPICFFKRFSASSNSPIETSSPANWEFFALSTTGSFPGAESPMLLKLLSWAFVVGISISGTSISTSGQAASMLSSIAAALKVVTGSGSS